MAMLESSALVILVLYLKSYATHTTFDGCNEPKTTITYQKDPMWPNHESKSNTLYERGVCITFLFEDEDDLYIWNQPNTYCEGKLNWKPGRVSNLRRSGGLTYNYRYIQPEAARNANQYSCIMSNYIRMHTQVKITVNAYVEVREDPVTLVIKVVQFNNKTTSILDQSIESVLLNEPSGTWRTFRLNVYDFSGRYGYIVLESNRPKGSLLHVESVLYGSNAFYISSWCKRDSKMHLFRAEPQTVQPSTEVCDMIIDRVMETEPLVIRDDTTTRENAKDTFCSPFKLSILGCFIALIAVALPLSMYWIGMKRGKAGRTY